MIKNRKLLVKELASMLNDIDCSFNKFYTDIYAYVHEDGSVTLRDYANVGGNSWLEDEHYTIYTCFPNYSSPIDFFVTSEEIADALNMSVDDLENETRDYYNMSDFDEVSYYEICSMVSDTYADEIEKAYLDEYSDYREYLDQADDIISELEKRLETEKYENGLDEKMNSSKSKKRTNEGYFSTGINKHNRRKIVEKIGVDKEIPQKQNLSYALRMFDSNGRYVKRGDWEIYNGGYDCWWELSFNRTPVIRCILGELEICQGEYGYDYFDGYTLADFICSIYTDCTIEKSYFEDEDTGEENESYRKQSKVKVY